VQPDPFLPHHDGADIGVGGMFNEMIDRIATENLYSLALHDFRNGSAEFHADPSPKLADVGLGLAWVVGTGIHRSVKRAPRVFREALLSRFASARRWNPAIGGTASWLPSTYPVKIDVSLNRSFSVFLNTPATNQN
jgi:hypothetical protein